MVNLKIGGETYQNVDKVQLNNSDGSAVIDFMELADFIDIFESPNWPINPQKAYFENPYMTILGLVGLRYLSNYRTVYLENVVSISFSNAANVMKFINVIMPSLLTVASYFTTGGDVQKLDFTSVTTINRNAFAGTKITDVIIRGDTVPTINVTGQKASGVTLYVPSAMISAYQSDTNWATLISGGWTIVALEGSAYENTEWFKA